MDFKRLGREAKAVRRCVHRTEVALGSDHQVHLVTHFESEVLDCPISPDQARSLAAMLIKAAQMVEGSAIATRN